MIVFLKLFFEKFKVLNELEVGLGLDYVVWFFRDQNWKIGKISAAPQTYLRQSISPKNKPLFYPLFCLFPCYHYLFLSKTNNE